jgi:hypothetical protein
LCGFQTVFNEPPATQAEPEPAPIVNFCFRCDQCEFTLITLVFQAQNVGAQVANVRMDPLSKLRADVDVVTVNITVLRDLLSELKPGEELPEELALLEDLYLSLKEMQQRIMALITAEINDDVTFELLTVNQEINNAFEKYNRHVGSRSADQTQSSETEADRQLREQLESFGVYEKSKTGVPTSTASDAEGQLDSLRTVAFDKPMLTDEQAKEVEEWLGEGSSMGNAPPLPEKKKKEDDGL